MNRFKDKIALVTGAGQGIGFEICRMLAEEGAKVLLNDFDTNLCEQAATKLNTAHPASCVAISGDSGDLAFIQQMVDTAVRKFGKLDLVVANAGITLFGDFFNYNKKDFDQVMHLNMAGTFFLAQAAANQLKKQQGGSILFTSSVVGHRAFKDLAVYGMTKAAIEMLARNLVVELSPYQINVNTVAPGATLTERTAEEEDYEKIWSAITPMGRPAYVSDIAHAALFLLSDAARHITGQNLLVDGGYASLGKEPVGLK